MDTIGLISLYESGLSLKQVAAASGLSFGIVQRRLQKAGVTRTSGQGVSLAKSAPAFQVTPEVHDLVDGLLLGDGHITEGAKGRLSLSQTVRHREWVQQVAGQLTKLGVEWAETSQKGGEFLVQGRTYTRTPAWGVRTRSYTFFSEERRRWYPEGGKRVPKDVSLTPLAIALWYFGDGGAGSKGYHATFSTDGFPEDDVKYLIERLHDLHGWTPTHADRNRILLTHAADRASLYEMLKDRVPSCFVHKMPKHLVDLRATVSDKVREDVLKLRREGASYGVIRKATGLPKGTVATLCQRAGLMGYTSRQPTTT